MTKCVPRSKHSLSQLYKTNLLRICEAKVAVDLRSYKTHKRNVNTMYNFFNFKPGVT